MQVHVYAYCSLFGYYVCMLHLYSLLCLEEMSYRTWSQICVRFQVSVYFILFFLIKLTFVFFFFYIC